MDRQEFVRKYVDALRENRATVFVGAGLSRRANYPDWRALLESLANELGISLEHEPDLVGVAQWAINRDRNDRRRIAQLIKDSFPDSRDVPPPHRVLSRLPIKTLWTTNYDRLLERAWELAGRSLDVKSTIKQLSVHDRRASGVLYKLHGTVEQPSDIVIATDDYELYRRDRAAFIPLLNASLTSQTFVFLGVGFSDPNLKFLLGLIREQMPDVRPEHYAIIRRPNPADEKDERVRAFQNSRHKHWIEDLQRYGIKCVEIDRFEDVDSILMDVERMLSRNNILVSGSWPDTGTEVAEAQKVFELANRMGAEIVEAGLKLVTGFGLLVGSASVSGALEVLHRNSLSDLDSKLLLRPFPQALPENVDRAEFNRRYRQDLIESSGVAVFIGGIKRENGKLVEAQGVFDEYEIARQRGCFLIPVAAFGGASLRILEDIKKNPPPSHQVPALEVLHKLADLNLAPADLAKIAIEAVKAAIK